MAAASGVAVYPHCCFEECRELQVRQEIELLCLFRLLVLCCVGILVEKTEKGKDDYTKRKTKPFVSIEWRVRICCRAGCIDVVAPLENSLFFNFSIISQVAEESWQENV